jgi:hypothetical protein
MTVLNIHYAGGKCVRMASEHTLPKTAKVKKKLLSSFTVNGE